VDVPLAALVPVIVAVVAWAGYCLFDLARSQVRGLPKWAWALVIVASVPLGGVAYLVWGRVPR